MSEVFLCDLDKISRWHLRPASHKCRHDKSTSRSDRALGVCWAYLFIQATQVVPDLLFKLLSLGDPIKHVQIISNCHSNPLMPPFSDGWPSRIVKSPRIARSIHDTYAHRVYTALNKCEANLQYSSIILYIYIHTVCGRWIWVLSNLSPWIVIYCYEQVQMTKTATRLGPRHLLIGTSGQLPGDKVTTSWATPIWTELQMQ